jgi:hypothetical protein
MASISVPDIGNRMFPRKTRYVKSRHDWIIYRLNVMASFCCFPILSIFYKDCIYFAFQSGFLFSTNAVIPSSKSSVPTT